MSRQRELYENPVDVTIAVETFDQFDELGFGRRSRQVLGE